jgi:hypothetical protein
VKHEIVSFKEKNLISLQTASTSKGNQQKWFDENGDYYIKAQFWYQGKYWRDDLVEIIGSAIGEQMILKNKQVSVLNQKPCNIELMTKSLHGVYSKNFCREGERFFPFQRILFMNGLEFPYTASIAEKWNFVLDTVQRLCHVDYTDYLIVMTIIDFLVGNEDRHLNNFGLLTDDISCRLAPLFDFGLGLFEHDRRYEGTSFRECVKMMECKPFYRDNCKVIDYINSRYPLEDYLPAQLDLGGYEFPSAKATSYLLNRGRYLGVDIKGVE